MPLPGEIWNVATNAWEAVPEEEIEDRVRAGTHVLGNGIQVPVVDSDGVPWFIPSENVADALAFEGYQIETSGEQKAREFREKHGRGFGNTIRGFVEESFRAAIPGGDVVMKAFGADPAEMRARKEELGLPLTILADVAGIAGTLAVPFSPAAKIVQAGAAASKGAGAALAGFAAKGAAQRVAARTVEAAIGTAIEGTAYSTGMVMSDAALGDPELTASRAWSQVGLGAITGAGFGIGAKAIGAGVSKFKGALAEALDPDKLAKIAGKAEGKGLGLAAGAEKLGFTEGGKRIDYGDLGQYALNEPQAALGGKSIGRTGANGDEVGWVNPKTAQKNARAVMDDAIERQSSFTGTLDEKIGGPSINMGEFYRPPRPAKPAIPSRVEQQATGLVDEAGRPIMRAVEIPGIPGTPAVPAGKAWGLLDDLQDPAMRPIREAIEAQFTQYADDFAGRLVSTAEAVNHKRMLDRWLRKAWGAQSNTPAMAESKKIRHWLNEFIDEKIDAAASRVGMDSKDWLKAKKDFGWAAEIERWSGKLATSREKQRVFSLSDHLIALGIGASFGGASPAWALASIGGFAVNKVAREHGQQIIAAAADRASKLEFLRSAAASAEKRMRESTGRLLKPRKGLPAPALRQPSINLPEDAILDAMEPGDHKKSPHEALVANVAVIDRYATSPEALADVLDKNLAAVHEVAPEVARSMAGTTVRAVLYLQQEAPRATRPTNPFSKQPPVSDMERAAFETKLRAVNDPLTILEDAADGSLKETAVLAAEAVHPAAMADMRLRVAEALAQSGGEGLNNDQMAAIGMILGAPLATILNPDVIASLQAVHERQAMQQAQAGARAKDIDLGADQMAGESEAWERRRTA